jgi:hypothetical protein
MTRHKKRYFPQFNLVLRKKIHNLSRRLKTTSNTTKSSLLVSRYILRATDHRKSFFCVCEAERERKRKQISNSTRVPSHTFYNQRPQNKK